MQDSKRQIKIGGIISYMTAGFSIMAGLIYTPWMISIIGKSNFGLFTLVTSLVTLVTIDLGLSQTVTRFISKYRAENDTESTKKFLGIVYKLFILLAAIFLITLSVLYLNIDKIFLKLSTGEIEKVKVLLSIAGLYAVVSFPFHPLNGLLISGEWFIFLKTSELITRVLNILLMVVALLMGYGLYSLVIVNSLCGLLVIGIKLYFLKTKDPQQISWKSYDQRMAKEIFSFSLWVMIISVSNRLLLNITPSILGITSGSNEIAVFSASISIQGYIWTFATVFSGMFLPKVSRLIYGDKVESEEIQNLMTKVGRIQFVLQGAIVSIFIVAGKDFFFNWLGPDFQKSYLITVLLILPGLITIPQEIASTALIASNKIRFNALAVLIMAITALPLSYFLSVKYGSIGSGIAIFIGSIIGGVLVMNIIYSRVLNIRIWLFFKKCQISMSFPFILVISIGVLLNYFITEVSWINLLIKIAMLFIIYVSSAYFFALNSYEKDLIKEGFGKISRTTN